MGTEKKRGCAGRTLIEAGRLSAVLGLLVGGFGSGPANAQDMDGLLEAVTFYHENATSDLATMHEATQRLEALAMRHPVYADTDETNHPQTWLAHYWTALTYTQLGLFADDDRSGPYVELAALYLDRARRSSPQGDATVEADVLALEAQVTGFLTRAMPQKTDSLRAASRAIWTRIADIDPNNPMMWMSRGLSMIADSSTRAQAYEILERAIELYDGRMGTVRPNWGREFIDVWMGRYPLGEPKPTGATPLR